MDKIGRILVPSYSEPKDDSQELENKVLLFALVPHRGVNPDLESSAPRVG